jgi:hypothetical protein
MGSVNLDYVKASPQGSLGCHRKALLDFLDFSLGKFVGGTVAFIEWNWAWGDGDSSA